MEETYEQTQLHGGVDVSDSADSSVSRTDSKIALEGELINQSETKLMSDQSEPQVEVSSEPTEIEPADDVKNPEYENISKPEEEPLEAAATPGPEVEVASEACEEADASADDYDPEGLANTADTGSGKAVETAESDKADGASAPIKSPQPEEDEYDPENLGSESPVVQPSQPLQEPEAPKEPDQKEATAAPSAADPLKEAYEAVMQSDVVKLAEFSKLSQQEQMATIQQLLQEKHIQLPGAAPVSPQTQTHAQAAGPKAPVSLDAPMSPEEQEAYSRFLRVELTLSVRDAINDFPEGLRLFVGNLQSNSVTKIDLFRIFQRYGAVHQISIRQGYGFVQYTTAEECSAAVRGESGVSLHGREMRLDASKTRGSKNANSARGRERPVDDDGPLKRQRTLPDVHLYVVPQGQEFAAAVEKTLRDGDLSFTVQHVPDDPTELMRESAYSGVVGAAVVKSSALDLQVFEETDNGGIRFDEYLDVDPLVAGRLVGRAKQKKRETHGRDQRPPGIPKKPHFDRPFDRPNGERPHFDRPHSGDRGDRHGYTHPLRAQNFQRREWQRPSPNFQQPQHAQYDQGYPNQGYPNQGYPNQGYPGQGYPNQGHPNHGHPNQGQNFGSSRMEPADPALLQTLQNLDPATMQNVVNLLQNRGPQYGAQNPQVSPPFPQNPGLHNPGHPHPSQQPGFRESNRHQNPGQFVPSPPTSQVNSLLSQLQGQPQQPFSGAPPTNLASSALMDMLSRLGKQ